MENKMLSTSLLSCQIIANLSSSLREELGLPEDQHAIGLLSADSDDVTYIALDEATKAADVTVAYAKSLYAGAANATTPFAGEVIGILSGPNPDQVRSGLLAARSVIDSLGFRTTGDKGCIYLSHCVAASGSFLSRQAGVQPGQALSYLIAPPVEAIVGLDAALKASDVRLCTLFAPPSETNFGGGLLTGTQSACQAACDAFAEAVRAVAGQPII